MSWLSCADRACTEHSGVQGPSRTWGRQDSPGGSRPVASWRNHREGEVLLPAMHAAVTAVNGVSTRFSSSSFPSCWVESLFLFDRTAAEQHRLQQVCTPVARPSQQQASPQWRIGLLSLHGAQFFANKGWPVRHWPACALSRRIRTPRGAPIWSVSGEGGSSQMITLCLPAGITVMAWSIFDACRRPCC